MTGRALRGQGSKEQLAPSCSELCMRGAARPNCHMLKLSHLTTCRRKAASMPASMSPHCILSDRDSECWCLFLACAIGPMASARPHCILNVRDLRMMALVFGLLSWSTGLCHWSANCGCLCLLVIILKRIKKQRAGQQELLKG